jgi:alkaline phosphatase D
MHRFHHRYHQTVGRFSRRELLNIAWKIGAAAVAAPLAATTVRAQMAFDAYPFPLGVASGDPWPTSVVLWTRLAPKPLDGGGMPMANIEVIWEVARDRAFANIAARGVALARPEVGHSVHVDATGLDADREYFYRFRVGREASQVGRTRTAPADGAAVERLRFAVCGCNHYETGFFTAFQRIAEEQFDFVFHTGDYIYEGRDDGGQNTRVRHHLGQEIYTLVDYRNRYAQYKMDRDLRAAHASAPFIATWDDHEVDNDYAGRLDEHNTPAELFLLRRAAAYQAFYEHMPVRAALLPTGPDLQLYRRLRFGALIDLTILDTRQYRSNQACEGTGTLDCAEFRDPSRTMLGATQERWLTEQLTAAHARWTVIGQQVPTFARDFGAANPATRFSTDKWDGYASARDRLFASLVETKAANPIVLSGDVHVHYASDLRRDFTRPASPVIGCEFTNTSITSGGDGSDVAGTWDALRQANPHLRYHAARRGYIACTATPTTMTAEFKVLERVSVAGEPATVGTRLVVEAGRPGLQAG